MEHYEFRIFPPARPYAPPDGAAVFVSLKSDKHTGLGTIAPKREADLKISAAALNDHTDSDHSAESPAHEQLAADSSVVPSATRPDSVAPRLPAGISLDGRRLVQYAVGGSAFVRPARFTPVYNGDPSVILCSDTKSFRKLCRTQVQQGDSVIDIGASYGASTQVVFEQCGNVLGLDVSKEAVAEARRRYPDPSFERLDALAEPQRLQVVLRERRPNKVFVDIGGNRELPALVALLPALGEAGVAHVFVKSQALVKSSLRHLRSLEGGEQTGPAPASATTAHGAHPCAGTDTPACKADAVAQYAMHAANACSSERFPSGVVGKNPAQADTLVGADVAAPAQERAGNGVDSTEKTHGAGAMHAAPEATTAGGARSSTAQRKRRKRDRAAAQRRPSRVLWRWCNQNMPLAWDLDLQLPEGSVDTDGRRPLVREGLAIVQESGQWWSQLVRQATPKKYPLDYPIRLTAAGAKICRFHNYGTCTKHAAAACPLDHDHCHACGQLGHTAAVCCVLRTPANPA